MEPRINREHKDALFKLVFGDHPENALSLYNAINHTDYTNVEDLEITTLKDAVYIGIKNDVSFLFNHDMNLYEHQSKFCANMPLRGLGYFANLYEIYLGGREIARERMYSKRQIKIPAPKYYVFYNGLESQDEIQEFRLSSAYDGEGDIEVVAHAINVNAGHNIELMEECTPLYDYSELINRIRENIKSGMIKEEAAEAAIDSCIKDGILENILRKEKAKVTSSLITALTDEEIERLHQYEIDTAKEEGVTEGYERGLEQGLYNKGFEDVDALVASGLVDDVRACEILGVDLDAYKEHNAVEKSDQIG